MNDDLHNHAVSHRNVAVLVIGGTSHTGKSTLGHSLRVIWVGVTFLLISLHDTREGPFVVTARYPHMCRHII